MIEHLPERCPLCGAPVSESRFAELQSKWQAASDAKDSEVEAALAGADRRYRDELTLQRAALEKDRDDQIRALNTQRIEEQQKWQTRLTDLQRQVDNKTADDLGHWPEVDLYQALQDEFQDDRVTKVGKGEEGADIVVEVMHRGETCGKIVVDSKNRRAWRDRYTEKLRQDRDAAKAGHGVLATVVFPSGTKDICMRDGVIVVRPHMVVTIVRILRLSIVSDHVARLSTEQREAKATKLYEYLSSGEFRQRVGAAVKACEELQEIDVDETRAHQKTWQKRGTLELKIIRALGDVETSVSAIIEVADATEAQIA